MSEKKPINRATIGGREFTFSDTEKVEEIDTSWVNNKEKRGIPLLSKIIHILKKLER